MQEDYNTFGLDKTTVTTNTAKKAYYNMALLIHPDKNICPDRSVARDEMQTITQMYQRIMKDIHERNTCKAVCESKDLTKLHEEELNEIDNFSKEMPSFMDIYIATHDDIQKFNKAWENRQEDTDDYKINLSQGYNTLQSEYVGKSTEVLSYSPNVETPSTFNKISDFIHPDNSIISIDQLGSNVMSFGSDYQEAHGLPSLLEERLPSEQVDKFKNIQNIDELFQMKCDEMNNQDFLL